MNKAMRKGEEFLEQFTDLENDNLKVAFGDAFHEFIVILNECDLSEETLDNLNGIFNKDMKIFFGRLED